VSPQTFQTAFVYRTRTIHIILRATSFFCQLLNASSHYKHISWDGGNTEPCFTLLVAEIYWIIYEGTASALQQMYVCMYVCIQYLAAAVNETL
jgi:hypothetical protein